MTRLVLHRFIITARRDVSDRDHLTLLRVSLHLGGEIMGWGAHVELLGMVVGACVLPTAKLL